MTKVKRLSEAITGEAEIIKSLRAEIMEVTGQKIKIWNENVTLEKALAESSARESELIADLKSEHRKNEILRKEAEEIKERASAKKIRKAIDDAQNCGEDDWGKFISEMMKGAK